MKKTQSIWWLLLFWMVLSWCSFFWWDKQEEKTDYEFYDPCSIWSWFISLWEYWNICKFDDWSFCSTTSFLDWTCKSWDKYEEVKYSDNDWLLNCPTDYVPVCWEDGYLYLNDCFLDRQWISKSQTLVEKDGACVLAEEISEE